MNRNFSRYKDRRNALVQAVAQAHPSFTGKVYLFAPCDDPGRSFVQDSSFYYFSGIVEPASMMLLDRHEQNFFYPAYTEMRNQWVASDDQINQDFIEKAGFDRMCQLGHEVAAVHIYPYFDFLVYQQVIAAITEALSRGEKIFTIYPTHSSESVAVRMVIDRLALVIPHLLENIVDVSPQIARLRRKKDMHELEVMYKAVDVSIQGHYAAISMLQDGKKESDMQAALEYVFTEHGATCAYPSIVAGGVRGTILHYDKNNHRLNKGDLVVLDAGARYGYYSADLTRTYPVSGTFTQEQKDLYEIVLATQEIVAEAAKPGVWLFNKDEQEASLHHIGYNFLKKYGYEKYFIHGIGHFLGLDVHDVGDRSELLQEGDVITIEPGIYIPEKNMGIRIEDNYWIVDQTTPVCLSEALPKTILGVEEMIQQTFDVDLK
jgi:Xaa-Pro aminopeptidase